MTLKRIHHVAYRCNDASETMNFYRHHLGMEFKLAIAEDQVPSTGEPDPYMHIFMDAGMGNALAFFELPTQPAMDRDRNTPEWVQHIAFEVDGFETLMTYKRNLERAGVKVLGPTDHGIFDSIYFFDPNGHRLELAANKATDEQLGRLKDVADEMIEEWSVTKKAPKHTAWLHKQCR